MADRIAFRRGYKYQLAEPYVVMIPIHPPAPIEHALFSLTTTGRLRVEAYYAWDGASGPTRDTKSSMRPSLVHDVLYQCMRLGVLSLTWRPQVDDLFYEMLRDDGMWRWRAFSWWRGVRRMAGGAATSPERPVEYAP